ncbi:MAG: acetate kinase [Clostridia bacterium]|nr:acetate kinase [Clostridia bacterium]
MRILVVNAGSSSLKYQLIDMTDESVLVKGLCENIGTKGNITHKTGDGRKYEADYPMPTHKQAISLVLKLITEGEYAVISDISEIGAVGHRVAHGGEKLRRSTVIDDEVLNYLETIVPINPLHGPPAILGMRACIDLMPTTLQVGVFDTSFYGEIPDYNYIYPIPYSFYEEDRIRKYGFHGTSHRYVMGRTAEILGKDPKDINMITCHLGNGSSVTAEKGGVAIDTSMGFTPQDGVVMGTRSGAMDPTVVTYIMKNKGISAEEAENLINKKSGILGVSGVSNDLREIAAEAEKGNYRAELSRKMLANSIKKLIGAYTAELNGLDVLVFTAGIGENDAKVREMVCENLEYLGIKFDVNANMSAPRGEEAVLSTADSKVKVLVVPTNEELMIARDTASIAAK